MYRSWLVGLSVFGILLGTTVSLYADNKGKSAQEKRDDAKVAAEKKDVKQAQDKLKEDSKELQEAQRHLAEAEAREGAAKRKLDEVRKRVKASAETKHGIDKALAAQSQAQKAFDAAAAPILKALKDTKEYKAAAKHVEAASAQLKQLNEDKSLSENVRREERKKASQAMLAVSELEQRVLTDSPQLTAPRSKLSEAQEHLRELNQRVKDEIDSNRDIASSIRELQAAAEATEVAGDKVQRLREKSSVDAAKLNREQQQLKQAEVQDKLNDRAKAKKKAKR